MAQRILLADDAPAVRQGVKALLEGEGFEVVGEAENGQEAVRLAQALRPDVAILDLSMPELSGLDAAREIQQLCPWTHLILLTVYTEEHHIITALRAGIRGYVVKAEAADDLARAIGWVSRGGIFLSPTACRVVIDVYLSKDNYPLRLAPRSRAASTAFAPPPNRRRQGPHRQGNERERAYDCGRFRNERSTGATSENPGLFLDEPSDFSSRIPGVHERGGPAT